MIQLQISKNRNSTENVPETVSFEVLEELFEIEHTYTYTDIQKVVRSKEFADADANGKLAILTPVLEQLKENVYIKEYTVYMDYIPSQIEIVSMND